MRDFNLKLLSVGIALLLVLFVNSDSNVSQIGFVVPVEVQNIPQGKVLVRPLNMQAQVTVRGPSFIVSQIPLSPPNIKLRVPSNVENRFVASLKQQPLDVPPSVKIVSIEPTEVEFVFDNVVTREVPVVVPQFGTLPENVVLQDISVRPERVTVRGPEREVGRLSRIETEPIDLSEFKTSDRREVAIRTVGPLVELSANRATVAVAVNVRKLERRFSDVPVEARGAAAAQVALEPSKVTVELSGPLSQVQALTAKELSAFAQVDSAPQEPITLPLSVVVPSGLTILSTQPSTVQVRPLPTPSSAPTPRKR